jgi:hypothetical protein
MLVYISIPRDGQLPGSVLANIRGVQFARLGVSVTLRPNRRTALSIQIAIEIECGADQ